MTELVTYTSDAGGVGRITLCRPEVLNAVNGAMMSELGAALDAFDEDDASIVAVLVGQGRAFCAGADLTDTRTQADRDPARDRRRINDLFLLRDRYKPIIAAVQGHAVGMGLRITLLCDFVLCAESARFRAPEVSLGLDGGEYWGLLQLLAGDAFAMDVVATGRPWTGTEAMDRGLVTRCLADDRLGEDVESFAHSLTGVPVPALTALVETRRSTLRRTLLDSWLSRARSLPSTPPGP